MPNVYKLQREMRELGVQMAADFEFNAMALRDISLRFQQFGIDFNHFVGECNERFNQVEGRMRLQEHRFTRFFEVVDQRLSLLERSA